MNPRSTSTCAVLLALGSIASAQAPPPVPAKETTSFLIRGATILDVVAGTARAGLDFGVVTRTPAVGGQVVSLQGLRGRYDDLFLPLYGAHQAENAAVAGFRRNLEQKGDNSLGIFSCSKATNEVNYLAAKLARVAFRNNNIDSCNRT